MSSSTSQTVWTATYEMMRTLGLTTIFGNPGSTEETMLKNFPSDFRYILALQEASVVAMADGFSQANGGKPVLVSLHTSAGTGNGMCNIMSASFNKTPLIILVGQQTREMIIGDPMLTNRDATMVPRPFVKWSYEPYRAQDVPAALMRAYAAAVQPPAGPVYLSIPLDDWDQQALGAGIIRHVASRFGPDPDLIKSFAERIVASKNVALVYGPEVDRSGAWDTGIQLAERLCCPVFGTPFSDRVSFPALHAQFMGFVPAASGPTGKRLAEFDLVVVIGAGVFRYYPYVAGPTLTSNTQLLQITNDPNDAAAAVVGDSLLSDAKLAIEALLALIPTEQCKERSLPKPMVRPTKTAPPKELQGDSPLTAWDVFGILAEQRPDGAIIVDESPSNAGDFMAQWPTKETASFFTTGAGGLGWGGPAAVGIAMAQRDIAAATGKPVRPVIMVIGDGSFQYSVQAIWTAVQHNLKIIYIVPCNGEYAILKQFSVLENAPNLPAMDLPGLQIAATAKAYGVVNASIVKSPKDITAAFKSALNTVGPSLLEIPIQQERRPLI